MGGCCSWCWRRAEFVEETEPLHGAQRRADRSSPGCWARCQQRCADWRRSVCKSLYDNLPDARRARMYLTFTGMVALAALLLFATPASAAGLEAGGAACPELSFANGGLAEASLFAAAEVHCMSGLTPSAFAQDLKCLPSLHLCDRRKPGYRPDTPGVGRGWAWRATPRICESFRDGAFLTMAEHQQYRDSLLEAATAAADVWTPPPRPGEAPQEAVRGRAAPTAPPPLPTVPPLSRGGPLCEPIR